MEPIFSTCGALIGLILAIILIIRKVTPAYALIFGALLVGERMTGRETVGCCLMFAAVILAQLSPRLTARAKAKKEVLPQ